MHESPDTPAPAPDQSPAPSPAARAVMAGDKPAIQPPAEPPAPSGPSLEELSAELAAEKTRHATTAAEKRQREMRIAELEDALHAQKQRLAELEAASKPARPARKAGSGWTLLHDAED